MSRGPDARTLVDPGVDKGSFVSWDEVPTDPPMVEACAAELASARERFVAAGSP